MRFPRSTKIFRGQLDAAPYAGVFFLMVIFLLLNSSMVFTPGVPIQLPQVAGLAGTERPSLVVVIDHAGQFYFENQVTDQSHLKESFAAAVAQAPKPLTLIIKADKAVKYETLLQLGLLARDAGIRDALLATRPSTLPETEPLGP